MEEKQAKKKCILGMPGYGVTEAGAGRALWRASNGRVDVKVTYSRGSLLAHNFNILWCQALNYHRLHGLDYFAMLHDDIEPEDGWLDILVGELEDKNLDILGCAVPIKDPKGLTSLALNRSEDDPLHPWRPHCRLTLHDVFRLPETFTSDDIGHPLLLNTGCWVCRFDPAWATKVHFTINDRIIQEPNGTYRADVEPEDWNFSRQLHKFGLRIGATRKIHLSHTGRSSFIAFEPWGEAFDSAYLTKSPVPDTLPQPIKFPQDVEGWLRPSEGRAIAELARGKRVLEIGSFCGKSAICMGQTAEVVHSVDPHDGRATTADTRSTLPDMRANLLRYGVENVVTHVGTIDEVRERMADTSENGVFTRFPDAFDLIFIDGDHSYEAVKNDIRHALDLLAPDGVLAFHDYREFDGQYDGRWDEGVTRAVKELIAEGGELLSTHSTVAVVKPPVNTPVLETANALHA